MNERKSRTRTTNRKNFRSTKSKNNSTRGRDSKIKIDEIETGKQTSRTNDIAWYGKNSGLLNSVANLSFGAIQGHHIPVDTACDLVSPGVMAITYVSGPGIASFNDDAVNVASRDIFSQVRKYNSGYSNYDPNDLMTYQLALGEVYAWHSYLTRMYGTLNLYNTESAYAPKTVVEAQGFDFDDMIKNMPAIRALLNTIAARANIFAVPKTFDYFTRQYWLPSSLYTDGNTMKHQIYLFKPAGYRVFGLNKDKASHLLFKCFPSTLMTFDDINRVTNDMLSAITSQEDFGVMSGDIKHAFEGNLWTLGNVEADYIVRPVHDYTVLAQIENLTVMGGPIGNDMSQFDITTSNEIGHSLVRFRPQLTQAIPNYEEVATALDPRQESKLINAHISETNPAWVMEATRLTAMVDDTGSVCSMGTELVLGLTIYSGIDPHQNEFTIGAQFYDEAGEVIVNAGSPMIVASPEEGAGMVYSALHLLEQVYMFDWCPQIYVCSWYDSLDANDGELHSFVEVENYTVVRYNTLNNIHYCALLSLFNVVTK